MIDGVCKSISWNNHSILFVDDATGTEAWKKVPNIRSVRKGKCTLVFDNKGDVVEVISRENTHSQQPVRITSDTSHTLPRGADTLSRDRLIVRQSCLKAAVEHINASIIPTLKLTDPTQSIPIPTVAILQLAEAFEKWVTRE